MMQYWIIIVAVLTVALGLYLRKKSVPLSFCLLVVGIVLAGVFLWQSYFVSGTSVGQATIRKQENALGYGISDILKAKGLASRKIVFISYGSEEKNRNILNTMKDNGITDVQFVSFYEDMPVGIRPDELNRMYYDAIIKADAPVLVLDCPQAPYAELLRNFKEKKFILIARHNLDDSLWKTGLVLAQIKLRPKMVPENLSSDPGTAFGKNYEVLNK